MQTYGICLDEAMGGRYGAPFVASLAEQLPQDCRWRVSYDKDAWWTADRLLAAALVNNLRGLVWGMADKSSRGPEPRQVGPAWAMGRRVQRCVAMDREALVRELARPRTASARKGDVDG